MTIEGVILLLCWLLELCGHFVVICWLLELCEPRAKHARS